MASHNNGTKKVASYQSKSDSSQFSKRKKDLENTKEGSCHVVGRVPYNWTQTDETLQIILTLDKLCAEELKEADVAVTDVSVHAKLPDGREWGCRFVEEVEGKQSRVVVQNSKLCIWLIKKKAKNWSKLQVLDLSPRHKKKTASTDDAGAPTVTKVEPLHSGDSGEKEKPVEEKPELDSSDINLELKEKEEEPVYYLQHTKNDWIESSKNDVFTIHVYVRQAPKDTVKIFYTDKTVTVKFQTRDCKFLALHANSTDDTVFCWKINLKHEIIPLQCRHKVTASLIEISLQKKDAFRWGALEAPVSKAPVISKSDSWLPVSKAVNQGGDKSAASQSDVAFDELGDVKILEEEEEFEVTEESETQPPVSKTQPADKENITQKPMCKVSPLNKPMRQSELVVSPGMTGLENLGNTCFMNSVLQALSNTREFRDYFLDARFQKEINTDNVLGTGGKLAVAFAVLMRVLWAGSHSSFPPSKLKNLIALKASQFTGYAQHDAQEFMAFLLDGLHEDLNRIQKKPYIETKDSDDRPDEVVADEAWSAYKKRNDSFVVDLFQGQYKSKLVCPECGKVSITFDPFLYLSVPLPKKKRLLQVTFMSKEPHKKPVKMILKLSKDATLDQLKEQVSRKTGIKPCDMRIFEAYKGKIHKFLGKNSDLNNIQLTDNIIVGEVLSEDVAGEPVYEIAVIQRTVMPNQLPTKCAECKKPCAEGCKLKRCTKCYKVGYCDQTCQKHHWHYHKPHCKNTLESVGCPFLLSIPQSRATFSRLCKLMEAFARYSVDVFQPPVKAESPTKLTSQLSNSDLSSSSQSSGSLSSLDSQSSLSSTCTLTAEGESRAVSDPEDVCLETGGGDTCSTVTTTDSGVSSMLSEQGISPSSASSASCIPGTSSGFEDQCDSCSQVRATFITSEDPTDDSTEMPPPAAPSRLAVPSTSTAAENSHGKSLPTNMVLGMQVEQGERITPSFYVKPVNQHGDGLTGPQGERLDDKGEIPLDLSDKHFISMDWKNNERLTPYVLVQTKQMMEPKWVKLDLVRSVKAVRRNVMAAKYLLSQQRHGEMMEVFTDIEEQLASVETDAGQAGRTFESMEKELKTSKRQETEDDATFQPSSLEENGNITLDQCLQLFTEPEVLAPDEAWYCPQCKEHREATKQMSIWRLPHTLIIQLKRFSFRNFIWRDKIDKVVEFPVRGLDLSPYFIGTRPASEPRPLYDLYAVVNHHGGILGGHYTSYVRCADLMDPVKSEVDWRLCDDSQVNYCSGKNVVTRAAYVLFYRRRNMFVPLPPALSEPEREDMEESSVVKGDYTNKIETTYVKDDHSKDDSLSDLDEGIELDSIQVQTVLPDNRYLDILGFTDMDSVD